ncbi:hypothetical protein Acife_0922 [Acidithiobacillus ferrivorans SS3]|uniref:DUF3579 domain-containing protein n=1 Tax=Acidithiobacillus ferrivorans SS3 TaxID=743299 RepID=G0JMZ0_9PROT|nr:DUF3579 domain-containing protein [Acidithiobacillus ferrivorans]AEM47095.1 hypothetical protein Acife_0922 [Acidithiobacillus ferrivorans SS3]OFA15455.1 hypothetical protein A4U49_12745 [Acidithiobacillus ferrivorans]
MLIVIEGVVLPDRRKFRPSDWAEMLIEGVGLGHFGPNHKIHYEDDVEPATIKGCASVIFDEALEQSHPGAYAELLHFATKNNLNIFIKEGTIPHVDGLADGRAHHPNQVLVDHDPRPPAEDKKDWHDVGDSALQKT